ncbi:unannotated protein [freshwater metagenome]|uniref:Unannotated protein n=1 Tax=freshwater metagenome TaxID=449393 RepID=A0A6J6XQ29_9ZZZZ
MIDKLRRHDHVGLFGSSQINHAHRSGEIGLNISGDSVLAGRNANLTNGRTITGGVTDDGRGLAHSNLNTVNWLWSSAVSIARPRAVF